MNFVLLVCIQDFFICKVSTVRHPSIPRWNPPSTSEADRFPVESEGSNLREDDSILTAVAMGHAALFSLLCVKTGKWCAFPKWFKSLRCDRINECVSCCCFLLNELRWVKRKRFQRVESWFWKLQVVGGIKHHQKLQVYTNVFSLVRGCDNKDAKQTHWSSQIFKAHGGVSARWLLERVGFPESYENQLHSPVALRTLHACLTTAYCFVLCLHSILLWIEFTTRSPAPRLLSNAAIRYQELWCKQFSERIKSIYNLDLDSTSKL